MGTVDAPRSFPRATGERLTGTVNDDAVEAECAKIIEHGEVECEKLASEHASRWRTIPKTVKLAPLTEFADDLARDGSEEALIELAEVNKVLGAIDESLVRRIVDE